MTQNLFTAVFDAQRSAIEQSHSLTHDAIEAQKASFDVAADIVENTDSLVDSNASLTKGAIHAYFDALESTIPDESVNFDDVRAFVDESIDSTADIQHESLDAMVDSISESSRAYDDFAASYTEAVDSSFDAFLDAHEQAESSVSAVSDVVESNSEEFDVSA